jgi:AcrR family transcriptional regulator
MSQTRYRTQPLPTEEAAIPGPERAPRSNRRTREAAPVTSTNDMPMRERLLREATDQFAAIGYEATTMRSIASRAGVTLPTLYHYFGDKANLYLEACVACFAPRAERGLAAYAQSTGREEDRVLRFFVELARDLLENENFFRLIHREMIDQDIDGIRRLTERCWKQSFAALCAAFGSLVPGQDPLTIAFTSFALMFGLVEFRRKAPFLNAELDRHYSPRGLAELVLTTTVPTIGWRRLPERRPRTASTGLEMAPLRRDG